MEGLRLDAPSARRTTWIVNDVFGVDGLPRVQQAFHVVPSTHSIRPLTAPTLHSEVALASVASSLSTLAVGGGVTTSSRSTSPVGLSENFV